MDFLPLWTPSIYRNAWHVRIIVLWRNRIVQIIWHAEGIRLTYHVQSEFRNTLLINMFNQFPSGWTLIIYTDIPHARERVTPNFLPIFRKVIDHHCLFIIGEGLLAYFLKKISCLFLLLFCVYRLRFPP